MASGPGRGARRSRDPWRAGRHGAAKGQLCAAADSCVCVRAAGSSRRARGDRAGAAWAPADRRNPRGHGERAGVLGQALTGRRRLAANPARRIFGARHSLHARDQAGPTRLRAKRRHSPRGARRHAEAIGRRDRRSEARLFSHGAEVRDGGARAAMARAQHLRRDRRALSDRGRRPFLPPRMSKKRTLSRRSLLRDSAAAAAGGAALLAQAGTAFGPAAAAVTQRRFKAWISRGEGPGRTTLQEATLRPIAGRQVLVRTEATNLCYTLVPAVLGLAAPAAPAAQAAPAAGALTAPPSGRRINDMA